MQPETKTTHYALVKINDSVKYITHAVTDMPVLRRRLEKYKDNKAKARSIAKDLQQVFDKTMDSINTIALALLEMDVPDLAEYSANLSKSLSNFKLITPDYSKLCAVLTDYLNKLPAQTANHHVISRLMNNVKMGYYPTDLKAIEHLKRGIEFPEDVTINFLDPCSGCGLALHALAPNCQTYGIELDRYRAEESLSILNRVGFGSYFHSKISNEAFHAMLLNPPYLNVMVEGGNKTRSEKRFLIDSINHLMIDGLLIYIIPYYRMTADICRVLCDNFTDLTVWKFTGNEFERFKQVAIMGKRIKQQDGADQIQALASFAFDAESIPALDSLPEKRYALPAIKKKVDLFKGAEFNEAELAEQLARSKSFTKLFEKSKLDSMTKRPLLPLNIGQIGLVGGSGLINGLVDCDTPHIIKGRIIKQNNIRSEENLNNQGQITSTTTYEVKTNKMIFNLLTPQGFKSLS